MWNTTIKEKNVDKTIVKISEALCKDTNYNIKMTFDHKCLSQNKELNKG